MVVGIVLNNREWATVIWVVAAFAFAFLNKKLRTSLIDVIKSIANPNLSIPLLFMWAYIVLEVLLGKKLKLWDWFLLKDTLIWVLTAAAVIFFRTTELSKTPKAIRKRILSAVGIAVFIEVLTFLYAFNIFVELALLPFLVLLGAISAVAAQKGEHKTVKQMADVLILAIGVTIIIFTISMLVSDWNTINKTQLLQQFALPVWLAIGLLPFSYILALFATYQITFMRIGVFTKSKRKRLHCKMALVVGLNVQARKVEYFVGEWLIKITKARTFKGALKVVNKYKSSEAANPKPK